MYIQNFEHSTSKCFVLSLFDLFLPPHNIVLFVGAVMAATVELISLTDSTPIHSYGAVTRWICMYPKV